MTFSRPLVVALLCFASACAARPEPKTPVTTSATMPASDADATDESTSATEAAPAARAHRVSALEGVVTFTMKAVRPPRVKTTNDANGFPRSTIEVDLSDKHSIACNVTWGGARAGVVAVREGAVDLGEGEKAEAPVVDITAVQGRAVVWTTTTIKNAKGEAVGTRDVAVAVRPRYSLYCRSTRPEESARFRSFIEETLAGPTLDPPDAATPRRVILYKITRNGKPIGYDERALYDEPDGTWRTYNRAAMVVALDKGGAAGVDFIASSSANKKGEELSYDCDHMIDGEMVETFHLKRDGARGYTLHGRTYGKVLDTKLATKGPLFATETPAWEALLQKVKSGKAREARFSIFQQSKASAIPVVVRRRSQSELSYVEANDDMTLTLDESGPARWQGPEEFVVERIYVGGGK